MSQTQQSGQIDGAGLQAQSKYDVLKATSTTLQLGVEESFGFLLRLWGML